MFALASYHRAETIDQAIEYLSRDPRSIPLAGGTDVLIKLRKGNSAYSRVVDLTAIPELRSISLNRDGSLVIGAAATFSDLLNDPLIKDHLPVLAQAAATVAGPQIRNMATVGGNICNGAPSADSAGPLLIHNAQVLLQGPEGPRRTPLEKFYLGVGRVDLTPAEIMTGLAVAPEDYQGWQATYFKYAMREAMDIATIGCAGGVLLEAGRIKDLRLAYTVAGPTPLRCPTAEALARDRVPDAALLDRLAETVLADLQPRDSWRAAKDFREHIIKILAGRVLARILEDGGVSL